MNLENFLAHKILSNTTYDRKIKQQKSQRIYFNRIKKSQVSHSLDVSDKFQSATLTSSHYRCCNKFILRRKKNHRFHEKSSSITVIQQTRNKNGIIIIIIIMKNEFMWVIFQSFIDSVILKIHKYCTNIKAQWSKLGKGVLNLFDILDDIKKPQKCAKRKLKPMLMLILVSSNY